MSTENDSTSAPLHGINHFRRDLLAVVSRDGPTIGLRVKDAVEEAYGEEVNHGRLYPALDDLLTMGLISKEPVDDRANHYGITARGRRELAAHSDWFREASLEDSGDE